MKTRDLEFLYQSSAIHGLTKQDVIDMSLSESVRLAILYGIDSVRVNRHKKAMSIPGAGWVPLSEDQLNDSGYEWVAIQKPAEGPGLEVLLGRGNPYSEASDSVPLPRIDGHVAAIPFTILRALT